MPKSITGEVILPADRLSADGLTLFAAEQRLAMSATKRTIEGETTMQNKFIGKRDGRNVFEFDCPGCKASGEIGIPERSLLAVRHECGMLFMQKLPSGKSLHETPRLVSFDLLDLEMKPDMKPGMSKCSPKPVQRLSSADISRGVMQQLHSQVGGYE